MQRRMAAINESIERYLRSMDTADRAEPEVAALKKGRLQEKIQALRAQMEQLKVIETQMNAPPDKQVSLTDPDARSMKNREGGIVANQPFVRDNAAHLRAIWVTLVVIEITRIAAFILMHGLTAAFASAANVTFPRSWMIRSIWCAGS